MSESNNTSNYHAGCRKKQNKKRQATSPLTDYGPSRVNTSEKFDNNREQKKGVSKKGRQECNNNNNTTQSVNAFTYDYMYQNMAFQQQMENTDGDISRKIVWDNDKVSDFKSLLTNNNEHIQRLISDISSEPIDQVVRNFTQLLHDKAFDVFGKTYSHKKYGSNYKKTNKE